MILFLPFIFFNNPLDSSISLPHYMKTFHITYATYHRKSNTKPYTMGNRPLHHLSTYPSLVCDVFAIGFLHFIFFSLLSDASKCFMLPFVPVFRGTHHEKTAPLNEE